MNIWQAVGLFLVLYLVLLARSAFIQGELRQFGKSLALFAGMLGLLALIISLYLAIAR